jgi:hypothetical protein
MIEAIHGSRGCFDKRRFMCMICWRLVCWCYGCADDADIAISANRSGRHKLEDTGICDGCWCVVADGKEVEVAA